MIGSDQKPIEALIALLPDTTKWTPDDWAKDRCLEVAVNAALPKLRETCDYCPACVMAAIRQAGFNMGDASDFQFKDDMKVIWDQVNEKYQ